MAEQDTEIPGSPEFPSTVWSRLVHGDDRRAAADYLAQRYWKPVYFYIRRRWGRANEDAKDLVQGFFADALQRGLLSKADPQRGSFRKFLRAALENFLRNAARDAKALKRGGGVKILPLESMTEEESAASLDGNPEELFDRDWMEAVFEKCLPMLREQYQTEGRPQYFEVFRRYDLDAGTADRPTYDKLAKEFQVPATDVRNWLAHARGRWQKLVREELRETTASNDDFEREVQELFKRS
jgi:RNA polymerase sigma factor (sigma-70 family)